MTVFDPSGSTPQGRTVIILMGIDGQEPDNDVAMAIQDLVQRQLNKLFDLPLGTMKVFLTTNSRPTRKHKEDLGERTLYLMQFDVVTPWREVSINTARDIEARVVLEVLRMDLNVVGTVSKIE